MHIIFNPSLRYLWYCIYNGTFFDNLCRILDAHHRSPTAARPAKCPGLRSLIIGFGAVWSRLLSHRFEREQMSIGPFRDFQFFPLLTSRPFLQIFVCHFGCAPVNMHFYMLTMKKRKRKPIKFSRKSEPFFPRCHYNTLG